MSRIGDAEVFVAVVDSGGFTTAAQALGLSQPAVSRRVTGLEARLGVRLLARSTRRIRPTDAGRSFYERCRRALAELEEAESEAAAQGADLRGTIRLTAPPAFGRAVLLPHLAAFSAAHAAIAVDLRTGERQVDLGEEAFDLAVRIGNPGRAPGLIHTRLADFDLVTCASPAYLAAHGTPRSPAALARHACLVQAAVTPRDVWAFSPAGAPRRGAAAALSARVAGPLRSNDVESLAVAARCGMGIAVLPDYLVADDLARGALRRVLPRFAARRVDVYAVYAERRHLPARVRALLDFLVTRLRRGPR